MEDITASLSIIMASTKVIRTIITGAMAIWMTPDNIITTSGKWVDHR